jgi:hypothetical protein
MPSPFVAPLLAFALAPGFSAAQALPALKFTQIAELADGLSHPHEAALSADGKRRPGSAVARRRIRASPARGQSVGSDLRPAEHGQRRRATARLPAH